MSIAASNRIPNEMCNFKICIDSYNVGEMQGRICNSIFSEPFVFQNMLTFLKTMELLLDTFDYPQASTQRRSFRIENQARNQLEKLDLSVTGRDLILHSMKGIEATLQVRVMFRQNTSWQGTIHWLEENKKENFRSVLELLMLIDSIFGDSYNTMRLDIKTNLQKVAI